MPSYVLEGMSEEARSEQTRKDLTAKREKIIRKLKAVNEELEDVAARRKDRVKKELHYAKFELERVKQQMSSDPYNNAPVMKRRQNARNKSKIDKITFQQIQEPMETTSSLHFDANRLTSSGSLNQNNVFGRVHFQY